jgi:hypothetical protein
MRTRNDRFRQAWWCGLAVAGLAGCGADDRLRPVKGRVEFLDGEAVTWGMVELVAESGGLPARGQILTDGSFTPTTGTRPGIKPGRHRVVISQTVPADPRMREHRHSLQRVDQRYAASTSSPLVVEVPAGKSTWELKLTVSRPATR